MHPQPVVRCGPRCEPIRFQRCRLGVGQAPTAASPDISIPPPAESSSSVSPTFADLGVPSFVVANLDRRNISSPFPIQAATLPRPPRRPRRVRPCPDRLGQDPRLRHPARHQPRQRPRRATPDASSSCPPVSSPRRSAPSSRQLAGGMNNAHASKRSTAASASTQAAEALGRGRRHRRRLPGPSRRPDQPAPHLPRRRRHGRPRRGRPHGRHGLPPRGASGCSTSARPTVRRCCSRPPSTVTSTC